MEEKIKYPYFRASNYIVNWGSLESFFFECRRSGIPAGIVRNPNGNIEQMVGEVVEECGGFSFLCGRK